MARNKQEDRLSALVRSTKRDTWEKGQQAGRWLSQHMYSEKEKREMEKKRRAQQRKAQAQAAQPESAPEESAPGAGQQGQKPTPATGVSAQQNAAWQAAADGDGQAPVFSLTASSRAHAPQKDNAAQQVLLAPGFQPLDMEQEIQRAQTYMQALMQGAREESQARQEQREQQQAAQQAGEAALSPSDSLKQQLEALMRQRTSTAYSGPDMRTNEEKRGGLLRTEAAALQGINTQIEQTKQAYGQAFQTELAQAENTLAQRDADTMQQWLSTSYFMSGPQREGVENAWAEYQNTELGRIAQKDSLAAAELMTPEEYEYYTLLAALRTKANPVTAGMAGLTQPVISAIPFYENALKAWEEWAPQQLGFEPVAGTGVQETFQNAQLQHPAAYSVGRVAGEAAANSTLQGLLSNTPVGTWFNSFGQKASQTAPMQALQQLPGVGHLGTPQSITGILEGTAYDTLTQTGPYVWNQLDAYGRQQAEGLAPGEQPITPGGIALGAAQNFGQNLGYNILGEWGLGIMDGGRHGPMQEAMDAAQRRAFAKSAAGEAMTPQEKQLVDDLWNTDPHRASEYWAAGEFLDTEVPGTFPLDGSSFDGTMKAKAEAPPTGQRTPFDYLQDGKGWEEPHAGSDDVIRDGSHMSNGKLQPNVKYQSGEFEYIYQTDGLARVYHVKASELRLTERVKRLSHKRNTPGKRKGTDHAGHLIGDLFGGSPELDNLVSQLARVNQSEYRRIEIQWEKALRRNQHVSVDIEVLYQGSDMRPSGFQVEYIINGDFYRERFGN